MIPQGFDLSHLNQPFNWNHVSPNIKFCFLKATQGATFKDPSFQSLWQSAKDRNIIRGAYHFLTFVGSAQTQANNFLSRGIAFNLPGVLPPVVDIEDQVGKNDAETKALNDYLIKNPKTCIQLITDFLNIVEDKTGRKPIIYSYKSFFSDYLQNNSWPENPLWLAAYQSTPPGLPKGWDNYLFQQNSERGMISGALTGGEIDMDLFNGTFDELNELANIKPQIS